jgi:hypothetical protein
VVICLVLPIVTSFFYVSKTNVVRMKRLLFSCKFHRIIEIEQYVYLCLNI